MGKHHVRGSEEHSDSARLPRFTCWIDQPNRYQHLREDLTDVRELTLKRETGPAVTATVLPGQDKRDSNAARYRGCGSGDAGTGRRADAKQEGKRDPGDGPAGTRPPPCAPGPKAARARAVCLTNAPESGRPQADRLTTQPPGTGTHLHAEAVHNTSQLVYPLSPR